MGCVHLMAHRKERDEGSRRERHLAREILATWKNIRLARSKNGFANTNVKIVAHKESLDPEEEKVAWEAEIQREMREASERHRLGQKREVAKYEEEMENWMKKAS